MYLYKKTHRVTGLKYLGMTTKNDPYKYLGSGTYWRRHLDKHGNDIDTEILLITKDIEELRQVGLHYSTIWDVVKSNEWANLKEESGDGFTSEFNKKKWEDDEYRDMMTMIRQEQWNDDLKAKRSELTHKQMADPEMRKTWLAGNRARWDDPLYVKKISEQRQGRGNNRFDKTIYHFVHNSGIDEKCTRYDLYTKYDLLSDKVCELVNGNRKTHKGWKIVKEESNE
jgi:hypothetical protein